MTKPLVSVIVPVYNVAPYLKRSVQSLIDQTYSNLQILLIDDCSTDESATLIAEFAARDPRITPIYCDENRGVSAARNAGLAKATGLYVAFMDGDDWVAADYVANFVKTLEAGPYDLLVSPFYTDAPEPKPVAAKSCVDHELTRKQLLRGMLAPAGVVRGYLWNKFYRRSVITALHLTFDENVAIMEDELFNAAYIMATSRFFYYGTPGYHHVVRADSATRSLGVIGAVPQQLWALWRIGSIMVNEKRAVGVADPKFGKEDGNH
ncbi:glycosyltransferase family 2 protein [Lacticaseibacillus jixiensis]|uniref:glycosyltransferase family 2 protein n=1 Tax=Lacticaseibacillus jixiensis TaxID=3231926 RepID=UPI0036F44036